MNEWMNEMSFANNNSCVFRSMLLSQFSEVISDSTMQLQHANYQKIEL